MWCSSRFCSESPTIHSYTSPLRKLFSLSPVDHCQSADRHTTLQSFSSHNSLDALNHLRSNITKISTWISFMQPSISSMPNPSKIELPITGLQKLFIKFTYPPDFLQYISLHSALLF